MPLPPAPPLQAKGLFGLYWKDGKRELSEDEVGELIGDELDTYLRWVKKKKGAKSQRGKVRRLPGRHVACSTAEPSVDDVEHRRGLWAMGLDLVSVPGQSTRRVITPMLPFASLAPHCTVIAWQSKHVASHTEYLYTHCKRRKRQLAIVDSKGTPCERDYAVRTAKKASASKAIVSAAAAAARAAKAAGESVKGQQAAAQVAAETAADNAVKNDMTGTLKPFTRGNIKGFVADAMTQLKDEL
eukprot:scaffold165593_cov36-Tisochrysis_lutea.AAC.1